MGLRDASYLSYRKQFITSGDKHTNIKTIKCRVPQGSTFKTSLI